MVAIHSFLSSLEFGPPRSRTSRGTTTIKTDVATKPAMTPPCLAQQNAYGDEWRHDAQVEGRITHSDPEHLGATKLPRRWNASICNDAAKTDCHPKRRPKSRLKRELNSWQLHASESTRGTTILGRRQSKATLPLRSHPMPSHPVPDGYRSITPYLKLPNAGRLVEFLRRAFGGVERRAWAAVATRRLAAARRGGDRRLDGDGPRSPRHLARQTLRPLPLRDRRRRHVPAGHRRRRNLDHAPDRHVLWRPRRLHPRPIQKKDWWIATRLENTSLAEMQQRATAFLNDRQEPPA